MRHPDGSVERALKEKRIILVTDTANKITFKLDDDSEVSLFQDFRQGADGGYYHELILAVDGREIAWR